MKFIVTDNFPFNEDRPPCEGAILEKFKVIEEIFDSPNAAEDSYYEFIGEDKDGGYRYAIYDLHWTIELESLDDLVDLQKKYGVLTITAISNYPNIFPLVIRINYNY